MPDEKTELEVFFELHAKITERAESLERLFMANLGTPYIPMNPMSIAQEAALLRTLNHALKALYEGHLQIRDMLTQKMEELDKK